MTDKFTPKQPTPRSLLLSAIAFAYVRGHTEGLSGERSDPATLAREELDSLRLTGIDGLGVEGRESPGGALKRYDCDRDGDEYEDPTGPYYLASDVDARDASRQQGEAVAWMLPDGEDVITAGMKGREIADGGKRKSGALEYSIALYTAPPALPAPALSEGLTEAARDVLDERERQKSVECWAPEHDDQHKDGELALAAACYADEAALQAVSSPDAAPSKKPLRWPWAREWWNPKSQRRNLVRAGALIIAEIERLDRAPSPSNPEPRA